MSENVNAGHARPEIPDVNAVGGELCLDFANTVGNHDTATADEHLTSYAELVAWGVGVGAVSQATAAVLWEEAANAPDQAEDVFSQAIALREAIFRIFDAAREDAAPPPEDLALLNQAASHALRHLRIAAGVNGYEWQWEETRRLDQVLWPVVRSATELLTGGELDRIRQCAGAACGWLFIDRSRNRSRRWCDMKECGNVAKVRRYRRRQQQVDEL